MIINRLLHYKIFRDIGIPFVTIGVMFYFAYWDSKAIDWSYSMYRQLFSAVFYNYFVNKMIYWKMKKEFNVSKLYVLLWEIGAPLASIFLVLFSLLIENKFYNWNVLINSSGDTAFYVAIVMLFLFLFFLCKGVLFVVKTKK
ncbi:MULTISPECIES: hypothetical protein [unclassified Flavobacterium]|uniref:hypothetical protein n=1 Tax=unclassified Flavobacterium TaxID=196869 RepID=UPI00131C22AB|nr:MULTISPECIES: hypothetical protein [unclassified Flavobacterium]